jgi:hypothetical protein
MALAVAASWQWRKHDDRGQRGDTVAMVAVTARQQRRQQHGSGGGAAAVQRRRQRQRRGGGGGSTVLHIEKLWYLFYRYLHVSPDAMQKCILHDSVRYRNIRSRDPITL